VATSAWAFVVYDAAFAPPLWWDSSRRQRADAASAHSLDGLLGNEPSVAALFADEVTSKQPRPSLSPGLTKLECCFGQRDVLGLRHQLPSLEFRKRETFYSALTQK
jgi:hypothetical protein